MPWGMGRPWGTVSSLWYSQPSDWGAAVRQGLQAGSALRLGPGLWPCGSQSWEQVQPPPTPGCCWEEGACLAVPCPELLAPGSVAGDGAAGAPCVLGVPGLLAQFLTLSRGLLGGGCRWRWLGSGLGGDLPDPFGRDSH